MKKNRTQIAIQREPFHGDRFQFLITHFGGNIPVNGWPYVAHARLMLEQVTPEKDGNHVEPTFSLQPGEAQELLDRLYELGLRPSREVSEKSALPYMQAHLDDMRRLVFETRQGRVEVREDRELPPDKVYVEGVAPFGPQPPSPLKNHFTQAP